MFLYYTFHPPIYKTYLQLPKGRGRRCKQPLVVIEETTGYEKLKEEEIDHTV